MPASYSPLHLTRAAAAAAAAVRTTDAPAGVPEVQRYVEADL